ncbi:NAD(P)-binding protein [Armillaria borealis]|uniref:NAD(P)-binding protein n=1 Tax=Armillaria borealis TaxID=47425 RepID=A0AA39JZY2_9AGAR|nr:NAD(P)-binding protein [Armillaria borealis]
MLAKLKNFAGMVYFLLAVFKWDRYRRITFDPSKDLPDLDGKVAIVTGGNTGIGFSTVKHLARRGAKVYIAGRNSTKVADAIERLKAEGITGKVEYLHLDLLDPHSASEAAKAFLALENRLDILINNAALLIQDPVEYHYGIADHMLTNHIGHFIFTTGLLPVMKTTAELGNTSSGRIVVVSSGGHLYAPEITRFRSVEDLNNEYSDHPAPYYGRYCAGKLTNVLFTKELQRRLDADGANITVMSLHPGNVNTFSYVSPFPRVTELLMRMLFMHPDIGAYTSVFAAASPEVDADPRYKGGYLEPVAQLGEASKTACDPEVARELWQTTEKIVEGIVSP